MGCLTTSARSSFSTPDLSLATVWALEGSTADVARWVNEIAKIEHGHEHVVRWTRLASFRACRTGVLRIGPSGRRRPLVRSLHRGPPRRGRDHRLHRATEGPAGDWDRRTTGRTSASRRWRHGGRRISRPRTAQAPRSGGSISWTGQYQTRKPGDAGRVATEVAHTLDAIGAGAVVAPLGLFHPDHVTVADACLHLAAEPPRRRSTSTSTCLTPRPSRPWSASGSITWRAATSGSRSRSSCRSNRSTRGSSDG